MFYGFIVILFAWLWQGWKIYQGYRSLDTWFLRLSALGMLLVTLDIFQISDFRTWAGAGSLVIILYLVYRIRR